MTDIKNHLRAVSYMLEEFVDESEFPDELAYFKRLAAPVQRLRQNIDEALGFEESESVRTQIHELTKRLEDLEHPADKTEVDNDHQEPHCDVYHELMEGEHQGG